MINRFTSLIILSTLLLLSTAFLRKDQEDTIQIIRKRYWVKKTHQDTKFNFLIYGDSRVYRGIAPSVLQKDFKNYDILNFAYSSASYSNFMLDEIEKKLDKKSKNKILLLGITPNSLTKRASADKHYKEELGRKREEILEVLYLKSIKGKLAPFKINVPQGDPKARYDYFEEYYDDGWVASWQSPTDTTRANTSYINNFKTNQISEGMIDTLMMRVATWRRNRITVIAFRPPTTQTMVNIEKASGFDEANFVKRFREAGGTWISIPLKEYETYDGSHLMRESALKYSKVISGRMKKSIEQ